MKDKADVIMELERLNGVKNELTEEVTRLHGLLEQERSKVAALTTESQHKHKEKVILLLYYLLLFYIILFVLGSQAKLG